MENGQRCDCGDVRNTLTIRAGSRYGSGLNSSGFSTLKIVALAPTPSTTVTTAAIVKRGVLLRLRSP
jgi:hypothetical protein